MRVDEPREILVEGRHLARAHPQDRVAVLPDLRERELPARLRLGVELLVLDDLALDLAFVSASATAASVVRDSADRRRRTAVRSWRRIAGAAAASKPAAADATARGRSVFATSCARYRPLSRISGAGPSTSPGQAGLQLREHLLGAPRIYPATTIRTRWRNGG